jgi:uncharacterized protein YbjQ (UPF0145 family)
MGFFGGSGGGEDLPDEAETRLTELAGGGIFTSTLGVGEFALLSALGPAPVAQVMGASVHQVGWQYLPPEAQWGGELVHRLEAASAAWDDARDRAFARLAREAGTVGADAVVGVELVRGEHDWARGTVDYLVRGTAIRSGEAPAADHAVVLTDLSVQDYWKLTQAGWAPAGLVAATAAFFVAQSIRTERRRRATVARNQELTDYSLGFSAARQAAVQELRRQARRVAADGIVGVEFEHSVGRMSLKVARVSRQSTGISPSTFAMGADVPTGRDSRRGIAVTIQAVGTAIRRLAPVATPDTRPLLRLGAPM